MSQTKSIDLKYVIGLTICFLAAFLWLAGRSYAAPPQPPPQGDHAQAPEKVADVKENKADSHAQKGLEIAMEKLIAEDTNPLSPASEGSETVSDESNKPDVVGLELAAEKSGREVGKPEGVGKPEDAGKPEVTGLELAEEKAGHLVGKERAEEQSGRTVGKPESGDVELHSAESNKPDVVGLDLASEKSGREVGKPEDAGKPDEVGKPEVTGLELAAVKSGRTVGQHQDEETLRRRRSR